MTTFNLDDLNWLDKIDVTELTVNGKSADLYEVYDIDQSGAVDEIVQTPVLTISYDTEQRSLVVWRKDDPWSSTSMLNVTCDRPTHVIVFPDEHDCPGDVKVMAENGDVALYLYAKKLGLSTTARLRAHRIADEASEEAMAQKRRQAYEVIENGITCEQCGNDFKDGRTILITDWEAPGRISSAVCDLHFQSAK